MRNTALATPMLMPDDPAVLGARQQAAAIYADAQALNAHVRSLDLAYRQAQQRRSAEAVTLAEAERLRREAEAKFGEAARAERAGSTTIADHHLDQALVMEKRAEDVRQQADETQSAAVQPLKTVSTAAGAATVTKRWTFCVVDLIEVPRRYLVLNEAQVREDIRDGAREIPGLAIYQDESLSVRK